MALSNLDKRFPIVDPVTGKATDYLMKLLSGNNLANASLEEVVEALLLREIIAGDGLDGGGPLGGPGNITLNANASDILDLIDNTQGAVLFRGAAGWEALAPGTAGDLLSSGGAGADVEWSSGGGGGGLPRAAGQTGRYYPPDTIQFNTATAGGLGNNTLYMHPFSRQLLIDQVCFEITAGASAGRNSEFCLYTSHPDTGMPYQLIEGSGAIASATGINAFTLSSDYKITETVWTGFCVNSSLFTVRIGSVLRFRGHQLIGHTGMSTTGDFSMFTVARTFGDPWPSDLTGTSYTISSGTVSVAVRAA